MDIYFNPLYDSSVFLRKTDCGLGRTFKGPDALLAELELRCGLTTVENEHSQRVISYIEAMQKAATNGTMPFYLKSFRQDDYGTAELMLGWRDALIRAGWDGKNVIESEKVRRLSEIECSFNDPGKADKWREIIAESGKRPLLGPSDRIKVCCRKDALDAVLARLLSNIEKMSGPGSVQYMGKDVTEPPEMEILEFDDEYRAHEWIATQELTAADVVAEADTALLGELLRSLGKPQTGAADNGIGPVMRLLPLGVALFKYPADIASLQSFLQSPKNPVGNLYIEREGEDGKKYHVKASIALLQHICANGGLGDGWDGIIRDARFTYDGKDISARDYDRAVAFLNLWDKSKILPEGKANVKDVKDFVYGLDKWAAGEIAPESNLDSQFHALRGSCRAMLRLLDSVDEATADIDRLSDQQISKSFLWDVRHVRKDKPTSGNLYPGYYLTYVPKLGSGSKSLPEDIKSGIDGVTGVGNYEDFKDSIIREGRRLLYVAVTRARDIFVEVGQHTKENKMITETMKDLYADPKWKSQTQKDWNNGTYQQIWGPGTPLFYYREIAINPAPEVHENETYSYMPVMEPDRTTAAKKISPSSLSDDDLVMKSQAECISSNVFFRQVISKASEAEDEKVGTCIHNIFTTYDPSRPREEMLAIAEKTIERQGLQEVLPNSEAIIESEERLYKILEEKYGKATRVEHEFPFIEIIDEQTIVGSIDLIWFTSESECVLVDIKNRPWATMQVLKHDDKRFLGQYAPQLNAYKNALERGGLIVKDSIIYLAMQAEAIRVTY